MNPRNITTITTCHNLLLFDFEQLARLSKPEYRNFMKYRASQVLSFQKASGVIFPSNYTREVVLRQIPQVKNSIVVAHGLDAEFLLSAPRSYKLGEKVNLLYVSTILQYKYQPEVVRAVKRVRHMTGLDIHLRLVGGGTSTAIELLRKSIQDEEMEDFVDITGELDRSLTLKEYHAADLFVFASSCETFGISLLEAMGARLPIMCSELTGLPDILKDAGVYFRPDDPESIASALHSLLVDMERRRVLGERAYYYACEYTWERCAQETFGYVRKFMPPLPSPVSLASV